MGPGKMKVCIPRTGVGQGFWSEKNQSIISTLGDLADIEKLSADKVRSTITFVNAPSKLTLLSPLSLLHSFQNISRTSS